MIDMPAARPMITLDEARDRRRATLEPWLCDGKLRDGRPCRKTLMELDFDRPSFIRKVCERCGHTNVHVETYRAS
jgi:hypothetical protein